MFALNEILEIDWNLSIYIVVILLNLECCCYTYFKTVIFIHILKMWFSKWLLLSFTHYYWWYIDNVFLACWNFLFKFWFWLFCHFHHLRCVFMFLNLLCCCLVAVSMSSSYLFKLGRCYLEIESKLQYFVGTHLIIKVTTSVYLWYRCVWT